MLTFKKLCLFFIISKISLATTEQQEQESFTKQYHNIIRQSLSKVSNVFDSIDYDVKDGKFKLKWLHGNEPTLDFSFDVIFQNQEICHLEFVIDSFLAHVPEKIRFDVNSAQINEIIQQVQRCSEKIQQKISGPSEIYYDNELLKQEQNLVKNESNLSDESKKEIERLVLLKFSDPIQKQLISNPQGIVNKMKVVDQYLDNEDISIEEKQEIKNQVLNNNSKTESYTDDFHSYIESSEQSVQTKKSSKEVDVGFTNDDQMPEYSQDIYSSQEDNISDSGFSEESQKSNKRITILDTVLNQFDHVDFSEESQKLSKNNSQESQDIEDKYLNEINNKSNSQESIDNKHKTQSQQSSDEEKVLNVDMIDQKQECNTLEKELIKEKLKFLILQNYIQDIKVFNENIFDCQRDQDSKINAILSFNREKCFISLDGTFEKGYKILKEINQSRFNIESNNEMMNCIDRFGTIRSNQF